MNVAELMTRGVCTCSPNDTLNTAARLMWENDCGAIPVVNGDGRVITMITDRDICMAAYTQGQLLTNMPVSSVASRGAVSVHEDETPDAAQALMQAHQVRRIPVVDADGRPVGIVSMNDLARFAAQGGPRRNNGLSADSIVRTLAAVSKPTVAERRAMT